MKEQSLGEVEESKGVGDYENVVASFSAAFFSLGNLRAALFFCFHHCKVVLS